MSSVCPQHQAAGGAGPAGSRGSRQGTVLPSDSTLCCCLDLQRCQRRDSPLEAAFNVLRNVSLLVFCVFNVSLLFKCAPDSLTPPHHHPPSACAWAALHPQCKCLLFLGSHLTLKCVSVPQCPPHYKYDSGCYG